jgi:pre-mRNA-splicing factor SYF2
MRERECSHRGSPFVARVQEEARKLNSEETAEEERRSKLPANFEAKKARSEWEESVEKAKKVCL